MVAIGVATLSGAPPVRLFFHFHWRPSSAYGYLRSLPDMPAERIKVVGARQHNLRNVTVEFPRNQLIVVTGVSGSGKSSLAFDTLFAEGQRRYVESLSAYARQFLDQMQKPDVDFIEGLSPAIALEQRTAATNPRSTVATTTEIYDYLRVLYAAIGQPHDPSTGRPIFRSSPQQIVDTILGFPEGSRFMVLAPVVRQQMGEFRDILDRLRRDGFVRARIDGEILELGRPEPIRLQQNQRHSIEAVVDRLVLREEIRSRLAESVETALRVGDNKIVVLVREEAEGEELWNEHRFSTDYGDPDSPFTMPELTPKLFSFNSHFGACPDCHGIGTQLRCDPDLVVPDREKSLAEGAVRPWSKGPKRMVTFYRSQLEALARRFKVEMETPFDALPGKFQDALFHGTGSMTVPLDGAPGRRANKNDQPFEGVLPAIERAFANSESDITRSRLRAYMTPTLCPTCRGARLRPEILAVTLQDGDGVEINIHQFCQMPVAKAAAFLGNLALTEYQQKIASEVLREIRARLEFLLEVGLTYLTLDRQSGTLSGGEAQRIRLATQIGSGLAGVLYVLDEPSIGLHQRDNDRLIATLRRLRDLGNTVVVVEHDEDTIRAADHVLDIGPGAGPRGGALVAQGTADEIARVDHSLTGQYLSGRSKIRLPRLRIPPRSPKPSGYDRTIGSGWVTVYGANENNLKSIDVSFPLGCYICVTGISGSGKSTLVDDILRRALMRRLYHSKDRPGDHRGIGGIEDIDKVIVIDQSPLGRTPRSNPITYCGAFTQIRSLFSQLPLARVRGYDAGRFSFNVKGGRCEHCQGDGLIKIEMHFLADLFVTCEVCNGARYNRETLEVTYRGHNIADILHMTVDEAARFFRNVPGVSDKLDRLADVGLGYIRLGQPATMLSGGEAQRVKLATELAKKSTGQTVYILDEPTTGLHFADIQNLLEVLLKLRDAGNTLIVIEHNLEMIKCADWIIDLGPEGGAGGGELVVEGTPDVVAATENSYTGHYLKRML